MNKIISPIAIDLGARNTGVYFAHYPAGSSPDEIDREGKVYQLEKDKYTLLMANRTAARHQRRGYDRRQMAKRLFKLIWCKHFGLPWDKDVQQTVGFLLNRRGFSFLAEEYNADILSQFPREAFEELPDELKIEQNDNGNYDYASALTEWSHEGVSKVKGKLDVIRSKTYMEKLYEACTKFQASGKYAEGNRDSNKLSELDQDVFFLLEKNVKGLSDAKDKEFSYKNKDNETKTLPYLHGDKVNLEAYINHSGRVEEILKSFPGKEQNDCWDFNIKKFDIEKENFDAPEKPENSTKKESNKYNKDREKWVRTHLHHLAFAISKIHNELESGGRHRSKYFGEVEGVLKNKNHTHGYLKRFCGKVQSDDFQELTVDSLCNLIGHICNLELKPLRKYFNHEKHKISKINKEGDQWDLHRITHFFERWILKEWRVNPQKDKLKAKGAEYDYKELRDIWAERSGTIIDFWLNTDPNYTIPPYQDNNNRRPPKCQSLLLSVGFLNRKYPGWRKWLDELKGLPGIEGYLGSYAEELADLESGKGKRYFTEKKKGSLITDTGRRDMAELDARILQFIFDRVKAEDPLKLNEIYSHAKKVKQNERDGESTKHASEKLKKAFSESRIPKVLKDTVVDGVFPEESFLHLVCKYYKLRQRARDGRIYIHPEYRYVKGRGYENTGRFDDKKHLLTYCNHKPRQKRYQMLWDLAGLLQVPPKKLEEIAEKHSGETTDDKLFGWLSNIKNLKANCERAASEQKNRRGRLKLDIQSVFSLIDHRKQNESPSTKEIKEIWKSSKVDVDDAKRLHGFCTRAAELCTTLTKSLYSDLEQKRWKKELNKNPATAVYLLAQINNIAFKERSGNANTCAVCSIDNSHRMQIVVTNDGKDTTARAQRLPAIPTRIIDGAVKRMASIVGGAIAEDKWAKIEACLEAGKKVCVPIITESNRFEFEPSREELVKGQRTRARKGKVAKRGGEERIFEAKDERIKVGNPQGNCPYDGAKISGYGEIDHIIPRRSKWGTLNDEANLIWASREGNQHKANQELSLSDLSSTYKESIFPEMNDKKIQDWIFQQIGDGSGEDFEFGKYRSFINLTPDQQTAFRHALFLTGHPLQEKVIRTIDNRNRTFVNGTQRYFAEVLANELYKLAKRKGKEGLLLFDYFGVSSDGSADSVPFIRKKLENKRDGSGNLTHPELQKHKKQYSDESKGQTLYSHLIDAQIAFMSVMSHHYNEGSLKISAKHISLYEYVDDNGELHDGYGVIKIKEGEFRPQEEVKLEREKPRKQHYQHRTLFDSEPRAWQFLKLIEISEENEDSRCYLKGFLDLTTLETCLCKTDWVKAIKDDCRYQHNNEKLECAEFLEQQKCESLIGLYRIGNGQYEFGYQKQGKESLYPKIIIERKSLGDRQFTVRLHQINKTKVAEFLLQKFNTQTNPDDWSQEDIDVFNNLRNLWYFTKRKKLMDAEKLDVSYSLKDLKMAGVYNPSLIKAWDHLHDEWQKCKKGVGGNDGRNFLRKYFPSQETSDKSSHQRARKEFSLPVLSKGQGYMLIKRNSWNENSIYQCQSEKSGDKGVGLYQKYQNGDGKVIDLLTPYFKSKNIVLLKKMNELKIILLPEKGLSRVSENKWYGIPVPKNLKQHVRSIENQYQSKGDSNYKITFNSDIDMKGLTDLMLGGFHIDEMKVGSTRERKEQFENKVHDYFKNGMPGEYLSIVQAKSKLEKEKEDLSEIKASDLSKEQEEDKKFVIKWLECLNSIQPDQKTLLYKRGEGLKIEQR